MIRWNELRVIAATPEEVDRVAGALADAYNDPTNAGLLGHTVELSEADVVEHYAKLQPPQGYGFLLYVDERCQGDGDLRGVADGAAEFAFLIANPATQGKGLGTRFATMVHAYAFKQLGLERVYAAVVPENKASLRVFEKLGYVADERTDLGDPGDVVLRLDRDRFLARHEAVLSEIRFA